MQSQSLRGQRLAAFVVAVVAAGVAAAGLPNRWAQDDVLLIEEHFLLHDLGNWQAILSSPYWPPPHTDALYRPVASLMHAMQYALGGGNPLAFRLGSMLLYALVALAVLAVARRLLPPLLAVAVALLFAAHPVHVEATALGVGQSELLVTLLALVSVTRYLDLRRREDGRLGIGDWAGLGAIYLVACLTKEVGIVIPALLALAEWSLRPAPDTSRKALVPGYVFLAAVAAVNLALRVAVLSGQDAAPSHADALEGLGVGGRILTMLPVVLHWVRLLAWPAHLQADYAPQEIAAATSVGAPQLLGLAVVALAVVAAIAARRRAPVITLGLGWMAVALAPVSNLLFASGIVLAERTLFLPSLGWLLVVGGALAWWTGAKGEEAGRRWQPALVGALGLLVALGVGRSVTRFPSWRDDTTYALQAGLDAPRSWRAQLARAEVLYRSGSRAEGTATYRLAAELAPPRWVWRVRNDLARRYIEIGAIDSAAVELEASLAAVPDQEETHHYLVLSYLNLARYDEAAARADTALARGFTLELFRGLRALADTLAMENAPPGSLRINVRRGR